MKQVVAAVMFLSLSLAMSSCLHQSYCGPGGRRVSRAKQLQHQRMKDSKLRYPSTGIIAATDGIVGDGVMGGRAVAGILSRGDAIDTSLVAGVAISGVDRSLGMTLGAGVRVNWPYSSFVRPKIEATFTNFTEHWGGRAWKPGWLITGDLGVDLVMFQWEHAELVVTPLLSMGVLQQDHAYPDGARVEIESDEQFYIGGRLGVGVSFW